MQSATLGLKVQLERFEGPLALLLYLIRKEEMDIFDIKINEITKQYLDYIRHMRELDLEVAGEFVAMAATLIQIKSRMLLPQYNEEGEVVENVDPRKELVQRLLEYQKFQEAATQLYERPLLGRDWWARGTRERFDVKDDEIIIEDNALFSLIQCYRSVMKTAKAKVHKVGIKLQSIAQRILEIRPFLNLGHRVPLSTLIDRTAENAHRQVLITFLSLLELGKMGFVRLFQSDVYTEIYAEAHREIEESALSRVEEYDNLNSAEAQNSLFETSPSKISVGADDIEKFEQLELNAGGLSDIETEGEASDTDEMASDDEILAAEEVLNQEESNQEKI